MMVTVTQATSQSNSLIDYVKQVLIIAYKEPTEALEFCFREEGFNCEVLRQKHLEEYKNYSNSYLCLLNHCQAWQRIIQENKLTLIVEADFVPVVGISQLPLPFDPSRKDVGIAWLYTCAPQVYSVSPEGFATGFSTSTVAYIVNPEAAKILITLEEKIRQNPGPKSIPREKRVLGWLFGGNVYKQELKALGGYLRVNICGWPHFAAITTHSDFSVLLFLDI